MTKSIYLNMVFIYALIDPFTCKIRYIGKSIRPKERLINQCNEHSNTYRCHWIQSLIKRGKKPVQVILQSLPDESDWQTYERKWIAIAKKYGWKLVNTTDGGDGVLNLTGESKERMLKTWKGRRHKPESIKKMIIASSGKKQSIESKIKRSEKFKGRKITWSDKLQKANRKFSDEKIKNVLENLSNGMTVQSAAEKYGVHRTTISKIKAGTYKTFKQKTTNYIKPRLYHQHDTISKRPQAI